MFWFFKKIDIENIIIKIKYNLITDEELRRTINSYDWFVRREVARRGKCLDILINDNDWYVRREVERQLKIRGVI
jgi:hypothetical protein